MAAPQRTPSELATLVHNATEGGKSGPFTLTTKTRRQDRGASGSVWLVVIIRRTNSWTGAYTTRVDGTIGKVYTIVDENGVIYAPAVGDTWSAPRGRG